MHAMGRVITARYLQYVRHGSTSSLDNGQVVSVTMPAFVHIV
jgi:hypothetical protein